MIWSKGHVRNSQKKVTMMLDLIQPNIQTQHIMPEGHL